MSIPGRRQRQSTVWKYGEIEYHFDGDGRVCLIYTEDEEGTPQVLGERTKNG